MMYGFRDLGRHAREPIAARLGSCASNLGVLKTRKSDAKDRQGN